MTKDRPKFGRLAKDDEKQEPKSEEVPEGLHARTKVDEARRVKKDDEAPDAPQGGGCYTLTEDGRRVRVN